MKKTISNVLARMKKYVVLLLLIPILTGGFSYLFGEVSGDENKQNKSGVYFAEATINLGSFNDNSFNHPDNVKDLVQSSSFLEQAIGEHNIQMGMEEIKVNLSLENVHGEMLKFYLTGEKEHEVKETLNGIVNYFKQLSDERYTEWVKLINNSIIDLQETKVIEEETIEKKEFLYSLERDLYESKQAFFVEPVHLLNEETSPIQNSETSPFKRAIFGVIIGLALTMFLVALPELFRD
jgi:teichuronic acid biosynthesis protein TuaF